MHKLLIGVYAAAMISGAASAQQHFTFTDYLPGYAGAGYPGQIAGAFDGALNGNLITNLSNISVFIDGVPLHGNGALFNGHFVASASDFVSGGAVASLDGTQNNFVFIDSDYPNDVSYTNFYYSVWTFPVGDAENSNTGQMTWAPTTLNFRALLVSSAPEPASWAMMLGGFAAIGGAMRSRRRLVVSFG